MARPEFLAVQADLGEEVCRMVKHKFSHTHRERSSFLILEGLPDSLPAYLAALNQRACAFPAPETTVSLGAALTFISTKWMSMNARRRNHSGDHAGNLSMFLILCPEFARRPEWILSAVTRLLLSSEPLAPGNCRLHRQLTGFLAVCLVVGLLSVMEVLDMLSEERLKPSSTCSSTHC
ncbi:hypothetical protein WJX84_008190 [Apatococcus fuscideae]|uniref:Uncharacterized protein n=1 Tax=Apatococcus fuscideae TaxID=2026836 RepID=A0AAW1TDJ4_9CHLO